MSETLLLVYGALDLSEFSAPQQAEAYAIGDRELDKLIQTLVPDDAAEAIRRKLKKEFGFSSLNETPDKVLRKIMRRRKIADPSEAQLIVEALDGDGFDPFPSKKRKQLADLLREYQSSTPGRPS